MTWDTERAEIAQRKTRLALLREIYRSSGRREAAVVFIDLSPKSEQAVLWAELEHMDMFRDHN